VAPFALDVLKIAFLVLLYLFVYRAVRAVVLDVRGDSGKRRRSATAPAHPIADPNGAGGSGKPPRTIVLAGARSKAAIPLEATVQVGRAEGCGVRVDDTYVSQFHARIFQRDGGWFVEDLGSTNGTFLNERKVTSPSKLHAGDQIRVGRTVLELRP
jgi:pSer/pThr/pTyr-binding forkhead associated (FHA) protein